MAKLQLTEKCNIEEDYEIKVDPSDDIFKWNVVTQQDCADLTASTVGARFWSYSQSEHLCWVKKANHGTGIGYETGKSPKSGFLFGNADCGVRGIRGK